MESSEIFAKRLKSARIMMQLSMDELCLRMDNMVKKAAISKYENAKMMPTEEVKKALAKALCVDIEYFSRPFTCTTENFEINYRKKSTMKVTEVNALVEKAHDKIERYLEIDKILADANAKSNTEQLPHADIKCKDEVIAFAKRLRKEWELFEFPIVNVQQELERHGIKVITINAPVDFDGLSGTIRTEGKDQIFIAINNNPDKPNIERRRFSVMHELGHQLMAFDTSIDTRAQENLCHAFASEMLLPSDALIKWTKDWKQFDILSLRPIQTYYGISIDAIMHKANELHIISESRYTYYNILKRQNKNFSDTVERSLYQEVPLYDKYGSLVLQAYSMHLIDKEKVNSLLYDTPDLLPDLAII